MYKCDGNEYNYKGYKYKSVEEAYRRKLEKQNEYNLIRKKAIFKKNLKQNIDLLFPEKDEVLELLRIVKDRLKKLEMQDAPIATTSSVSCDPGTPAIVYQNPPAPLILELVG